MIREADEKPWLFERRTVKTRSALADQKVQWTF